MFELKFYREKKCSIPAPEILDRKGFFIFIINEFGVLFTNVDIIQAYVTIG